MSDRINENETVITVEPEVIEMVDENLIKLNKAITFDGKLLKEVMLDLDNLTGEDIEKAEVQFVIDNPEIAAQTPLKEMSKGFLSIMAAKACKKPVEFMRMLSAPDFSKITTRVQIFLMRGN